MQQRILIFCLQHWFDLDIKSKELASTKKQAAQKVALSLVRQLFHLGAIEAATPGQQGAKKLKSDEVKWLQILVVFLWKFIIREVFSFVVRTNWCCS